MKKKVIDNNLQLTTSSVQLTLTRLIFKSDLRLFENYERSVSEQ